MKNQVQSRIQGLSGISFRLWISKVVKTCWPFVRKELCEARPKPRSVLKKSNDLFALRQMEPQMRLWVKLIFGQTYGQVDIWSDVPPDEALGQVDIWSDFGSDGPPNRDILWPSVTLGCKELWAHILFCSFDVQPFER